MNSDNYLTELEKIKFYRDRISQQIIHSGQYPNQFEIQNKLKDINLRIAIFQNKVIEERSTFNTKDFNDKFEAIYQDLVILYKVVYKLSVEKFLELKSYAEMHLSELEQMAKRYEYKTKFEIESTPLGKTVLFKTNGFGIRNNNNIYTIALGDISISKGSKLACIWDSNVTQDENVIFTIGNINCSPFSYNRDYLKIPGNSNYKTYTYEQANDTVTQTMAPMDLNNFTPNHNNNYIIYAGKNYIKKSVKNGDSVLQRDETSSFYLDDTAGRITFYILNGSYAYFNFSKEPLSKNFSGYNIESMDVHQKITFEYDAGMAFDFTTDGTVYAETQQGIIQNDTLYYPNNLDVPSYYIEEYNTDDKVTLPVTITVSKLNDSESDLTVNAIAIKELSILQELES